MTQQELGGAFADVLDQAMRRRRTSLSSLRDALTAAGHPISLATLSYWRSGLREPARLRSLEALPELERLLGLPGGTLTERLVAPRRATAPQAFDGLLGTPTAVELVGEDDVDRVLFHMKVDVGAHRETTRIWMTQGFVARRDGVDGVTIFTHLDGDVAEGEVDLTAVAGCTIGHVLDVEQGITATRLCFERPLRAGEAVMTDWTATVNQGANFEQDYSIVAEQRLEEAMVWIRFHADCVPSQAWVWFEEDGLRHEWPVDMLGGRSLHYRQLAFGPGRLGARWEW